MRRFAKEIGLIGGNDINERHQFFSHPFAPEDKIAVLDIGRHVQGPQPSLEADLDHGFFLGTQADARPGIDELAKARIVATRKPLFLDSMRMGHGSIPHAATASISGFSWAWNAVSSSAENTRSMSRIMMKLFSRLPMPLMKSTRICVPMRGAG